VAWQAFRRPEILRLAKANPYSYTLKPRLGTALQLLEATESVSRRMEDFRLPFLLLQGLEDTVTDPSLAQEFYRRAGSKVRGGRCVMGGSTAWLRHSLRSLLPPRVAYSLC
jgi:alpha-beta hydrolase superfamily lysophospholipase